jgi:hypothetical protein
MAPTSPGPPVVLIHGKAEPVGSGTGTVAGEALAFDPATGQPELLWTVVRQNANGDRPTTPYTASRR